MNEAFHASLHTAMKARAAEILPEVIELRRTIHKHPETGFDTGETEKLVKTFLEREHIAILPSELGVLGLIRGQNHDRIVALRADMDALPLQEETGLPYCSQVPGKMHACGHDGHTAMLLGTAKILQEYADELPTDILLIFQPAEEGPVSAAPSKWCRKFKAPALPTKSSLHSGSMSPMTIRLALSR